MKSKEEIIEQRLKNHYVFIEGTQQEISDFKDAILSAMEEYASQFKPTPSVSAKEEVPYISPQEFFNDPGGMFTLDFLTEEERDTLYAAIELYVVGRLRFAASRKTAGEGSKG